MDEINNNNDDFLQILFYFIPFLFNNQVLRFLKGETRIKGILLEGISHYVISSFISIIVVLVFIKVIDVIFEKNKNIKMKSIVLKKMIISPFMFLWILTLSFELQGHEVINIIGGYYSCIRIALYLLIFIFQLRFVRKIDIFQ